MGGGETGAGRSGRRGGCVRRWIRLLAWAAAVGLAGSALLLYTAHREIEATWHHRATSEPSRVYAAPLPLYPGLPLGREELIRALEIRGYRPASHPPDPGEYASLPAGVAFHLHDFVHPPPRGRVEGRPVRVRLEEGRVVSLRDARTGVPLPEVELEPLTIATLMDERMVRRRPVPLERIPDVLVRAVLAVEDRRFFEHAGLDPIRIAGAALRNLKRGELAEGGSTLTQQLVKNYYLTPRKTFRRKLTEAAMAVTLELTRSKREILEAYLNEVYLGQDGAVGIAGVAEASRHYFSRDVASLDLSRAALLAGMIRAPNRLDPFRHPEAARRRRNRVLALMERQGLITAEERRAAASAPLPEAPPDRGPVRAPWYVEHVRRELEARFSRETLRTGGLGIFTALEPATQAAALRAVEEGLRELERAHPRLRRGGEGALQAAMVVLDPRTGDLRALVGGRSWSTTQFDRATRARRQPGSLFKPIVYLAALAADPDRRTLASRIADSALTVPTPNGRDWTPSNHDGEEHGMVSLREALVRSHNLATVRLALEVGLPEVVRTARALGLSGNLRPLPSLALGAAETTPLEMARVYATLAGGGLRPEPISVVRVLGPDGAPVAGRTLELERAVLPGPVHLVNRALQGVLEEGTAAAAADLGYRGRAAGKTGTTDGFRDAWFVGYTPERVALVWVGFDDNASLGLTGAQAALPIWVRFTRLRPAPDAGDFVPPEGVIEVEIDRKSGLLADGCGPSVKMPFLEGTEPTRRCEGGGWWIF